MTTSPHMVANLPLLARLSTHPVVARALADQRGLALQLLRYGLVSAIALGADFLVFLALAKSGTRAALAGAAGYALGLVLHYMLSSRFVFDARAAAKSHARLFSEFALSGVVGLVITAGTIAVLTDHLHVAPVLAKTAAVLVAFTVVFILRRAIVFAPKRV